MTHPQGCCYVPAAQQSLRERLYVCVCGRERERVQRIAEAAAAAVNRLPRCAHSALLLLLCGFFFFLLMLLSVHYVAEFNQSRSKGKEEGVGGAHLVI